MILLVSTVLSEKVEGDNYPARPTKGFTRMVHGQLHMIKLVHIMSKELKFFLDILLALLSSISGIKTEKSSPHPHRQELITMHDSL